MKKPSRSNMSRQKGQAKSKATNGKKMQPLVINDKEKPQSKLSEKASSDLNKTKHHKIKVPTEQDKDKNEAMMLDSSGDEQTPIKPQTIEWVNGKQVRHI